jgi:RHS repeat-associated protein
VDDGAGGQLVTYQVDAAGRVQVETRHQEALRRNYVWDGAGRLTSATVTRNLGAPTQAASTFAYRYDHAGLRVEKSGPTGTSRWIWGADGLLQEALPDGQKLLHERIGDLVTSVGGERLMHDGLGSVVGRVRAGGGVVTTRFDAWGNIKAGEPGAADPTAAYAGQHWDRDLGLSYAQQRWYEPRVGRFLSEDPVSGVGRLPMSLLQFAYGAGNPLRYIDPWGTQVAAPQPVEEDGDAQLCSPRQPCSDEAVARRQHDSARKAQADKTARMEAAHRASAEAAARAAMDAEREPEEDEEEANTLERVANWVEKTDTDLENRSGEAGQRALGALRTGAIGTRACLPKQDWDDSALPQLCEEVEADKKSRTAATGDDLGRGGYQAAKDGTANLALGGTVKVIGKTPVAGKVREVVGKSIKRLTPGAAAKAEAKAARAAKAAADMGSSAPAPGAAAGADGALPAKTLKIPKEKADLLDEYARAAAEGKLKRTDPKGVRGSGFRDRVIGEKGEPPGPGFDADHKIELCVGGPDCAKTNSQWLGQSPNRAAGAKIGHQVKDDPIGTPYDKVELEK